MRSRMVQTNGVTLRVIEAGDPGAPLVVLCHGFPELAFSWRHQIAALAEAGYHVLAPDQRGYGGSDRPDDVDAYNVRELGADIVGLIDSEVGGGADKAALIGHDFGSVVAWGAPLFAPERFWAVGGLSLPPVPRPQVPTTQAFRRMAGEGDRGDRFVYILYFQERGPADAELARDPAATFRRLFSMGAGGGAALTGDPDAGGFLDRIPDPGTLPDWLGPDDFAVYVDEFTRTGFTGPLNWYRCFDLNWELTAQPPTATIDVPALFVGGTADATLAYTPTDRAREIVTGDYREVMLDGAGHWLTEERPAQVSSVLVDFLDSAR
ncbi:putative epoxide hydrolase EphA (epoxide hydratase) (arene-oxide hydratase) [Mycobacterium tuberculosis H37Rv] [Mycolicibacterium parafortuitum]|uniref:Putative epoxide hydrolase EphA (Epoxide hydratase) (Arene-oxide hydratase) [Mycobacterium tuberculosis H37Rv] n=2 Tax=Mycolicibacterium parafortuitum TaxID=39692 RepID=A0A375YBU5_MYCPF|nr:alpha/beta hydrolase [Mycolicibacterium parafortuitum]ORB31999.1 epoxide hydrolase [Mycolicibacterium parafortuitum]SRX78597.1 putative epoxide hydrolase EphA (epoxide hydratase) (arene-oxide hydratase) [Mycobacterium tuberculosis H37Rv] [Mycolicibacterium parafortuitum]